MEHLENSAQCCLPKGSKESGSTSTELRTPMQQAKREGKKEAEETEERQRRLGSAKEVEKGVEEEEEQRTGQDLDPSHIPPRSILFTPEQLHHMNQMYEQAPWLYGTAHSAFTPFATTP